MFRLRIFHLNDLHGRLADLDGESVRPVFSRIAGHVAAARAACAEKPDEAVLFFSGGDDLVGSPFAELAGTRPEAFLCHPAYRLYSISGLDACAIGNHDLDWGAAMLSFAAARDATFPLLAANLRPAAGVASNILPFAVLPVKGLRVGVIGLITPAEVKRLFPGEFEIVDPLAALLDLLPQVRAAADVVIVLSHLGHRADNADAITGGVGDVELARALPQAAVAAIIGSHTHTVLNERGLDPANVVNGILIAQAGGFGRFLGELAIKVSAQGPRAVDARLHPVDALPPDDDFDLQHVLPPAREVQRLLAEPLGVAQGADEGAGASFGAGELPLANFAADALVARCRAAGLPVDCAMVDASTVCDTLPRSGPLTRGDLFRLSPYADSIFLLRLPASRFRAFLDDNARRIDLPGEPPDERGFVQFSRELRYRVRRPRSRRAPATPRPWGTLRARRRIRAQGVMLNDKPLAAVENRAEPLLIAYSSFLRQFAHHWQQRARRQGLPLFDLADFRTEATPLAVREELVAYARAMGGATEASGLRREGRVTVD